MAMPDNDSPAASKDASSPVASSSSRITPGSWSILRLPPPLKRVFDNFPLRTYPINELPQRAPRRRHEHVLHVFTTAEDAERGAPSFNPQCLKYQTYLRFVGLDFRTIASSNHASPSGALPFLQPATNDQDCTTPSKPVPSNKLRKWLSTQIEKEKLGDPDDLRFEAYTAVLDSRIRKAWLAQLYLSPPNAALVRRLYVSPCSAQSLVQAAIAYQLRAAAEAEMIKSCGTNGVSLLDILRDAEEALQAMAALLGDEKWFFGQTDPGLFDASVFAYIHLVLDDRFGWVYNPLDELVRKHENLVQHRERILELYFP